MQQQRHCGVTNAQVISADPYLRGIMKTHPAGTVISGRVRRASSAQPQHMMLLAGFIAGIVLQVTVPALALIRQRAHVAHTPCGVACCSLAMMHGARAIFLAAPLRFQLFRFVQTAASLTFRLRTSALVGLCRMLLAVNVTLLQVIEPNRTVMWRLTDLMCDL